MAKNIHQQLIDGMGTITRDGISREFFYPDDMAEIGDILQDEDALTKYFKDRGMLLEMYHQAFQAYRVSWASFVCSQMKKGQLLVDLNQDVAASWRPKIQNLPTKKKEDMSPEDMIEALKAKGLSKEEIIKLIMK